MLGVFQPTFPIWPYAPRPSGRFSLIDQHRISSGSAMKLFCRSTTGFLTPREMAFALDRVQHRFSTKRRQSVASSTSPSRDFRPAGVSPALVWATSAAESLPEWPGTAPAGPPPPPSGRPPAGHGARRSPRSDQFLPQRRQRPVTHRSGQHGLPQEVAQVVRQHEQLQPHLVVHKVVTGQSRPFDRVLAFLDPLLRRAPLVVEPHHPFGGPA